MNEERLNLRSVGKFLAVLALIALPLAIVLRGYSSQEGFLRLIYFGQQFEATSLPEVRALNPPRLSEWGYDGQFYAQLALVPLLDRADLPAALDNPPYRARRIGLPWLAAVVGLGRPAAVLQSYAVLNLFFCFLLIAALYRFSGFQQSRDFLLAGALLWGTGALSSVARALTDFPAAVLSLVGVIWHTQWPAAALSFAAAGLFKETSVLSFFARLPPRWRERKSPGRLVMSGIIMLAPLISWTVYVHFKMSEGFGWESSLMSWPLASLIGKLHDAAALLFAAPPGHRPIDLVFELLCPLSLLAQAAYLFFKPRIDSDMWRLGIGFAVLLFCLGSSVWIEQYAYARVLLPLTFSFNLLLHKHELRSAYAAWYLAGNLGMAWICLRALPFFR